MVSFLLYILGIALVDSLNPSAIALVIVILISSKKPVLRALFYILGVFITYFSLGFMILLAYRLSGISWQPDWSFVSDFVARPPVWSYYLQVLIALLLILYPLLGQNQPKQKIEKNKQNYENETGLWKTFLLGVTVTFVEFSTALPYLAALTSIITTNYGLATDLIILVVYNFIFIGPPLLITGLYFIQGKNFESLIFKIKQIYAKFAPPIFKYGTIAIGFVLLLDSVLYGLDIPSFR